MFVLRMGQTSRYYGFWGWGLLAAATRYHTRYQAFRSARTMFGIRADWWVADATDGHG